MIATRLAVVASLFVLFSVPIVHCQQVDKCTGSRNIGDYMITWKAYAGEVQFDVSVPTDNGTWVAIGFSSDNLMPRSDIVIGSMDGNGLAFVEDRWVSDSRTMPTYDEIQDVRNTTMSSEDGIMTMSFVRNFDTKHDDDYTLAARCVFLLGAWGGSVTSYSSPAQFTKHPSTNRAAINNLLCLYECTDGIVVTSTSAPAPTSTSTSATPVATVDSSGGSPLSTTYIIIIVVVVALVGVAVILAIVLLCVCILTKKSDGSAAAYELDQVPAPHPATRRETMTKQTNSNHLVTIPINAYQEEVFEQNLYDEVARDDDARIPEARPDSFYDSEPQAIYDLPPPPEPLEQYEEMNPQKGGVLKQAPSIPPKYEGKQYDPIRHLLN